jgi:hypothetical protein
MQDRIARIDEISCTARPDHTFGSISAAELRRRRGGTSFDSGRERAGNRTSGVGVLRKVMGKLNVRSISWGKRLGACIPRERYRFPMFHRVTHPLPEPASTTESGPRSLPRP